MHINEYDKKALSTARDLPTRIYSAEEFDLLYEALQGCIPYGEFADKVKKQIFHGKDKGVRGRCGELFEEDVLSTQQQRLLNTALGLLGEAAEVAKLVFGHVFNGDPLNADALEDELGDVQWYLPLGAEAIGSNLTQVCVRNNNKLADRYDGGFSVEKAH